MPPSTDTPQPVVFPAPGAVKPSSLQARQQAPPNVSAEDVFNFRIVSTENEYSEEPLFGNQWRAELAAVLAQMPTLRGYSGSMEALLARLMSAVMAADYSEALDYHMLFPCNNYPTPWGSDATLTVSTTWNEAGGPYPSKSLSRRRQRRTRVFGEHQINLEQLAAECGHPQEAEDRDADMTLRNVIAIMGMIWRNDQSVDDTDRVLECVAQCGTAVRRGTARAMAKKCAADGTLDQFLASDPLLDEFRGMRPDLKGVDLAVEACLYASHEQAVRRTLAKTICHLAMSHQLCGTVYGLAVVGSRFARLYYLGPSRIAIEMAPDSGPEATGEDPAAAPPDEDIVATLHGRPGVPYTELFARRLWERLPQSLVAPRSPLRDMRPADGVPDLAAFALAHSGAADGGDGLPPFFGPGDIIDVPAHQRLFNFIAAALLRITALQWTTDLDGCQLPTPVQDRARAAAVAALAPTRLPHELRELAVSMSQDGARVLRYGNGLPPGQEEHPGDPDNEDSDSYDDSDFEESEEEIVPGVRWEGIDSGEGGEGEEGGGEERGEDGESESEDGDGEGGGLEHGTATEGGDPGGDNGDDADDEADNAHDEAGNAHDDDKANGDGKADDDNARSPRPGPAPIETILHSLLTFVPVTPAEMDALVAAQFALDCARLVPSPDDPPVPPSPPSPPQAVRAPPMQFPSP